MLVSTHLVEDVAAACTRVNLVDGGRLVFAGFPDELVDAGEDGDSGDSPIERGYTAVLRGARTRRRVRRPLQVELLRGTAPSAALAMFGGAVWMLCVHADVWAGRWAGLVGYFRVCLVILCALMVPPAPGRPAGNAVVGWASCSPRRPGRPGNRCWSPGCR